MGNRHMIVAGHHVAAQAGFQILESGGNAIDAGVAAGLALNVVESEMASFGGVAPIILYRAETDEFFTVSGLGGWPAAASGGYFQVHHGGRIPKGILRTVVPAAPDAWVTALERWGTLSFADVSAAAIRLAREGFVTYPLLCGWIAQESDTIRDWPGSAAMYLPEGRPPRVGEVLKHEDLANTLQFLADEEKAHAGQGREVGLEAVRRAFYRGDVAAQIAAHQRENGGLLTAADMADFRVGIEPPIRTTIRPRGNLGMRPLVPGADAAPGAEHPGGSGPRVHGPQLGRLPAHSGRGHGPCRVRPPRLLRRPRFVHVPVETLLSKEYAAERRRLIASDRAFGCLPPPGTIAGMRPAYGLGW